MTTPLRHRAGVLTFRAYDAAHRRAVHVRVAGPTAGPDERRRLRAAVAEASRVTALTVAPVVDAEFVGDWAVVVRPWIDGIALGDCVAKYGPLTQHDWTKVAKGVFDAVESLHDKGVPHGHLSASNLVLEGSLSGAGFGYVMVVDTSMARSDASEDDDVRAVATALLTALGVTRGGARPSQPAQRALAEYLAGVANPASPAPHLLDFRDRVIEVAKPWLKLAPPERAPASPNVAVAPPPLATDPPPIASNPPWEQARTVRAFVESRRAATP
ncbi:MAG: hypothetical protein NZ518_07960, partial [Dehalococcoidia bacterium]|nr:hypothetical protein [Dehalococcoidia bacterium]